MINMANIIPAQQQHQSMLAEAAELQASLSTLSLFILLFYITEVLVSDYK